MFYFQNLCKNSNLLDWRKKVNYFKLFHSSTTQSFMVDTLNLTVHVLLGMVYVDVLS
jgi:hypothetical protein